MNKKGFTLIEMLTTTAILVVVFALLAIIFGRATTIHKVVRSGGDAENLGIYLINTIVYGHGTNREEALIGAQPFNFTAGSTETDTLIFQEQNGQSVCFIMDGSSVRHLVNGVYVDLKPTWATDRQLDVVPGSGFYYYNAAGAPETTPGNPVYSVEIRLVLKNMLQNPQEAITLSRNVRIRNQINF